MRSMTIAVALCMIALPTATASAPVDDCAPDAVCGTVLVGTGLPLAHKVDHDRHPIAWGAVGIIVHTVLISEGPLPAAPPEFALMVRCPPGFACVQDGPPPGFFDGAPCLGVYARAGSAATPYAFSWAYTREDADLLLEDLPMHWATPSAIQTWPALPCA